ncbi:hypothetical protein COSO111634_27430 [Corallococcus soli]
MRRAVAASKSSVAYSSAPCRPAGPSDRMSVRSDSVAPHCTGRPGISTMEVRTPIVSCALTWVTALLW